MRYARDSSNDQHLDLQLDEPAKAGRSKIFSDKMSGINKKRPGLDEAVSPLRGNDAFVIWKLHRLGRNLKGLIEFIGNFEKHGIHFRSLTDGIDTTNPAARSFFYVMASIAQMERELLIERTEAGLEAAKKRGRVGRKRSMTLRKVRGRQKTSCRGHVTARWAQNLGVSVPTLYRWCPASKRAQPNIRTPCNYTYKP